MKAFLMYKESDFDPQQGLPSNQDAIIQDLELDTLFNAMAGDDKFLYDTAKQSVVTCLTGLDEISYRQNILKDCLRNPDIVREIYLLPIQAEENKRKLWRGFMSRFPGAILGNSLIWMQMFVTLLQKLKNIADEHAGKFESEGFTAFFAMIKSELDDDYIASVQNHLKVLAFRKGILLSAELGVGNTGTNYILRKPDQNNGSWMKQAVADRLPFYRFTIHPRDEHGAKALGDLMDRGINSVANALARAADHIDSFFTMLQVELAFYIGCLNLYEQLSQLGEPVCFPSPLSVSERRQSFRGLYDPCLALTIKQKVVGNDLAADDKDFVIITGANHGGKSTFLRSVGLAQLMMQSGMFVAAESFTANVCEGLFTHYKREEDTTMKSGKLDEELGRMSDIIDNIKPNSLVLFNESFGATNEREGSEIARQILSALLEKRIKIFFVTHLYTLMQNFFQNNNAVTLFLRAERLPDGKRTFKLTEGEPLQTSFAEDLYNKIFPN